MVERMDDEHPIRVAARRTGLTPHVIRIWEKRYGAVAPKRSSTNRRFYSDTDIERLNLLRRATQAGRSIGQIATLPTERLEIMVRSDENVSYVDRVPSEAKSGDNPAVYLELCIAAIRDMDASRFEESLARGSLNLNPSVFLDQLVAPLLTKIGELWNDGAICVAHEHLASAILRTVLGSMRNGHETGTDLPCIVVTTPSGQLHEFGALMAAITASSAGWRVVYLGPNLPAEEVARAVQQNKARAVALSVIYPSDDARVGIELQKLRRLLGNVSIIVGGRSVQSYQQVLQSIQASFVPDLYSLRKELEALRTRIQ